MKQVWIGLAVLAFLWMTHIVVTKDTSEFSEEDILLIVITIGFLFFALMATTKNKST